MTAKGKSKFKKITGWLHLWLGLISGIIVVIISVTGCLFSFQKEISEVKYKRVIFVTPAETAALPLARLQEIAQQSLGKDQPINDITVWKDRDRAWEFMAYKMNDTAFTYFGAMEYFRSAFINPYTGQVTGIRDYKTDFFSIVKYLHWGLLLNTKYGQPIVGWSTLIFALLLITGLILWWPRKWNRVSRKKSFTIYWKGRFRRLNYDLHNVPGFYLYIPALILALTGMVYAFQWFEGLVYAAASGTTAHSVPVAMQSADSLRVAADPMSVAYAEAAAQHPDYRRMNISPASGNSALYFYVYPTEETYYNFRAMQFDRFSGKLLHEENSMKKNAGERLIGMNYDIHVGAIGGIGGKIIAFLASLVSASLPITGFYIWWNRKRKRVHIPYRPATSVRKPVPDQSISESA